MKNFVLHDHLPSSKKVHLLVKVGEVKPNIVAALRRQGYTWDQILRSITVPAVTVH